MNANDISEMEIIFVVKSQKRYVRETKKASTCLLKPFVLKVELVKS